MDGIVEIIVALVFIIASIYSEVKKRMPTSSDRDLGDLSDLGSIDDFFKQQSSLPPSPPPPSTSSPVEFQEEAADASFATGAEAPAGETAASAEGDDVAASWGAPTGFQAPEAEEEPPLPKKKGKKRRARPPAAPTRVPPHPVDHPDWATNFDQEASLDGRINLEELGGEGVSLLDRRSTAAPATIVRPPRRLSWSRQDVCRAFLLSMVLEPYDINRAFNRLPGQRGR